MKTLKLDSNGDLFVDSGGNLVLLEGLDAVMQSCANYAKSVLGEMIFQTDLGVDFFGTVFGDVTPNIAAFKESLTSNLMRVPNVLGVESLEVSISDGELSYVAEIRTEFGTGVLNG